MRLSRHQFVALGRAITALTLLSLSDPVAWSQTTRTIKIVVPYQPGGASDVLARLLGEQIGRTQRQTVLIENRAGAGTVIGTEAVARASTSIYSAWSTRHQAPGRFRRCCAI
jgi:tripartite-type tricarboxylate transporter receptor subunit TctC